MRGPGGGPRALPLLVDQQIRLFGSLAPYHFLREGKISDSAKVGDKACRNYRIVWYRIVLTRSTFFFLLSRDRGRG